MKDMIKDMKEIFYIPPGKLHEMLYKMSFLVHVDTNMMLIIKHRPTTHWLS